MPRLITLIAFAVLPMTDIAKADDCYQWQCSPSNWNNSSANWDNSPANWRNSPANYDNQNDPSRGIYTDNGDRQGYAVRRPDGGVNIFDDDGNRLGYQPGRR